MANTFYPKGAQKVLGAKIDFSANNISAVLVPSGYTYSVAHEFLSEIGGFVGAPVALANNDITGGVFDADDLDFGALASGSVVKALAIYKDTGAPATSPLLCYLDVIIGFPFATNGGGVSIPWSNGAAKVLSLV